MSTLAMRLYSPVAELICVEAGGSEAPANTAWVYERLVALVGQRAMAVANAANRAAHLPVADPPARFRAGADWVSVKSVVSAAA